MSTLTPSALRRIVRLALVALLGVVALGSASPASAAPLSDHCVLRGAESAMCWGVRVGDGVTFHPGTWTVPQSRGALAITGTANRGCIVDADRSVRCWGGYGVSGPAPERISGASDVLDLSDEGGYRFGGDDHACAIRVDRRVICWGANDDGQLGDGTRTARSGAVVAAGITDAISIQVVFGGGCAVQRSGRVSCWGGYNRRGEAPTQVPGVDDAIQFLGSDTDYCYVRRDGDVICAGSSAGYDENGTPLGRTRMDGFDHVVSIARNDTDGRTLCAVRQSGKVTCRGNLAGTYAPPAVTIPGDFATYGVRDLAGVRHASSVVFGVGYLCVLEEGTGVRCAGRINEFGTGREAISPVPTAQPVPGLHDVRTLSAGYAHTCVLAENGETTCWGNGVFGQLAQDFGTAGELYGDSIPDNITPTRTSFPTDVQQLGAGSHRTCVIRGGTPVCVGEPVSLLPLDLTPDPFLQAFLQQIPVTGAGTDAVEVATGGETSCAVKQPGTVACWGSGVRGDGSRPDPRGFTNAAQVANLTDVVHVSVGGGQACAVRRTGAVVCWGEGADGQLGNGATSTALRPVAVSGLSDATAVVAGIQSTCALRANGRVACWGRGLEGELGQGANVSSTRPVAVADLTDAVAIGGGAQQMCAVRATGAVVCWGPRRINNYEPIEPREGGPDLSENHPVAVGGISDAVAVAVGFGHACAVRADRTVACWGAADRLGDGYIPVGHYPFQATLETVPGVAGAASPIRLLERPSIAGPSLVGWRLTCGKGRWSVRPNSYAYRWLRDGAEISGAALSTYTTSAVDAGHDVTCEALARTAAAGVPAESEAISVVDPASRGVVAPAAPLLAVGAEHGCVVRSARVFCFGRGPDGALGDGSVHASDSSEVSVPGLFRTVAAGDGFSCGVATTRRVSCWGQGAGGTLGDGSTARSLSPVVVDGFSDVRQLAAGDDHACGLRGNGVVWCWGRNSAGQLGTGDRDARALPGKVDGLTDAVQVGAGGDAGCAVRSSGAVVCWGDGPGTAASTATASAVAGIADAVQVAIGSAHACVLRSSGTVACWGANDRGQLGDGSTTSHTAPAPVLGLDHVVSITAGAQRSCAVKDDGSSVCWGDNAGPLGSSTDALIPTQVTGTDPVTEAATGPDRTCLLQRPGRRPACR